MLKDKDSHTESSFPSKISICEYHTQYTYLPLVHCIVPSLYLDVNGQAQYLSKDLRNRK